MTPKNNRLTKQDIDGELVQAKRVSTENFSVRYAVKGQPRHPKVSFVVSKKIAKTAVLRNRLRRRGYSSVAQILNDLKPGSLILVSYQKPNISIEIGALGEELKRAFARAGVLK